MPRKKRWEKRKQVLQGSDHAWGFLIKQIEQHSESSQSEIICVSTPILAEQPQAVIPYSCTGNSTTPLLNPIVEENHDPWQIDVEVFQTPVTH